MHESDGFHLLADELNTSVVKDVLAWRDHPELSRLVTKLLSHTSRKPFLDSFAEAMVARHLLKQGCAIRFEVPTPQGKRSDFEVSIGEVKFYLHVKRVETDLPRHNPKQLRSISARLRVLERIARPYIVQVRWTERINAEQMRLLVKQAADFIQTSRVGDELTVRDSTGVHVGGVRIIAPWAGEHVSVAVGLRSGFVDQTPRFHKMMERAHQQFMPRANNIILIASDHVEDVGDFEMALLGTHVERWDAFPPRGQRLAHGRADDGFWSGTGAPDARTVGWFQFSPGESSLNARLWHREKSPNENALQATLNRLFAAVVE